MRAWMFSSATSSASPLKGLASPRLNAPTTGVMGRVMNSMPRFFARRRASARVPDDE